MNAHRANAPADASAPADWRNVCALDDIPRLGARVVTCTGGNIALFRTADDEIFALDDQCPHRRGPLSQGIVYGRHVACPLHHWQIGLADGIAVAPDVGCTGTHAAEVRDGRVYLKLRPASGG